jgi:hypothetical protein
MDSRPPDQCPHDDLRFLGTLSLVPQAWLGTLEHLPGDASDLETAWCRSCERYVWRETGSPDWTGFIPPTPEGAAP